MPDIALVDSSDFQFLHQMKPFADLTDEIPELQEYSEKALAPCSAGGRIYGQPFGVNCTAMFYNKKILEKAGCKVPDNWEEFEEIAAKVSDKTIKDSQSQHCRRKKVCMSSCRSCGLWVEISIVLIQQAGSRLFCF